MSCDNLASLARASSARSASDVGLPINGSNCPQGPQNRKPQFPYAFLRSRLSVLPEEGLGHHHLGPVGPRGFQAAIAVTAAARLRANSAECVSLDSASATAARAAANVAFLDGTSTLGRYGICIR